CRSHRASATDVFNRRVPSRARAMFALTWRRCSWAASECSLTLAHPLREVVQVFLCLLEEPGDLAGSLLCAAQLGLGRLWVRVLDRHWLLLLVGVDRLLVTLPVSGHRSTPG